MRYYIQATLLIGSLLASATNALGNSGDERSPLQVNLSTWHVADASLDSGGDWSATSFRLSGDWNLQKDRNGSLGIGLAIEQQEHDFSSSFSPWETVQKAELSLTWRKTLTDEWSLLASPTVGLSREDGADSSDAFEYGTILAFNRYVSPTLQWGIGFGYFGGLEDSSGFPFLMIRWQINEKWYVGNPFTPGPVGPAGMELGYRINEQWSIAAGSAYRKERFALDDEGPYGQGYGETEGAVVFVRTTFSGASGDLHLFVGVLAGGELQIDNSSGNRIFATDFDPAPIAAISWQSRF